MISQKKNQTQSNPIQTQFFPKIRCFLTFHFLMYVNLGYCYIADCCDGFAVRSAGQCAITLDILNTGSNSAIAMVPMILPRIVIINGSIRAMTFLIEVSSFFS